MNYRILGKTGVKVSPLCMGTMSFGGEADPETSRAMFDRCRERGVNFFDCANVYARGRSEEILGECIATCRDEVVITSKFGSSLGDSVNSRGASRRHIMRCVEESLQRLKTDYIDVYFMHHFDPDTPLEETLRALDDLVRQGKVHYLGASNFAAWQVEKALGISNANGWHRFACIQPMHSLVKRLNLIDLQHRFEDTDTQV